MSGSRSEPKGASAADIAWRGIELCRSSDWQEGLYWLGLAADSRDGKEELPALFYAYFGYGVARYQKRPADGVRLCKKALELEFYQPEAYTFLAKTYLLMDDRRAAVDTVKKGLQVDSDHGELKQLIAEFGERRSPVLGFLSRGHPLNRLLGRMRHSLFHPKKAED